MNRRLLVSGLAVILLGKPVAAGQLPPVQRDGPACAAALAVVKEITSQQTNGKPWIVANHPAVVAWTSFVAKEQDLLSEPWQGEKPTEQLVRSFIRSQPSSALSACPQIDAYLGGVGIRRGDVAANDATLDPQKHRPIAIYSATILNLSLPVVSSDEHDALVEIGISGGWTTGAGSIDHLREQPDGNWIDVGGLHTWIG